ncbi:HEPN domain-containing protein [Candidatus Bathyarchaeota archaeon]|nr:HEPN domain-containing protein [Candidatus Bathyarchaeota archaeon]
MDRMFKIAAAYLQQARSRLKDAAGALKDGNYPYSLRLSQECVELSLKASLKLVGIEYPKVHDVSDVLLRVKERFPEWFKEELEDMCEASKVLASKREIAFYGSEEEYLSPEEIIGGREAESAVSKAEKTHRLCEKLLLSFMEAKGRTSFT